MKLSPHCLLLLFSLFAAACEGGTIHKGSSAPDSLGSLSSAGDASDSASSFITPASRLIGGAEINPNAFWPPIGKDCAATLGSGKVPSTPPQAFKDECSGCHGSVGQGHDAFPKVTGPREFSSFVSLIRAGRKGAIAEMPAFKTSWLNDNDLNRIYAYLTQTLLSESNKCVDLPAMSDSDVELAINNGLKTWRQVDGKIDPAGIKSNVACASCHAPDPLELAYLGYADGDIFRRGTQHLEAKDVSFIIDMVRGYRAKYNIGRRDPLAVRLFQPSGHVLEGNTLAERDAGFSQELVDMKLIVANRPINSAADAASAFDEVWAIDRHGLKIPVPFDRYTEDGYHNPDGYQSDCVADIDGCSDHGSIADWIPVAPHLHDDDSQYYAAADAFIADPSLKTFDKVRFLALGSHLTGDYSGRHYATGDLDHNKYASLLFASLCIRLEVLGKVGCYDQGVTPFPNRADIWGVGTNVNLFGTGFGNQPDYDNKWGPGVVPPAGLPQWPDHILADITPGATLSSNFSRLRAPWMVMWWTHFDPTLLTSGDPTAQKDEYFTRSLYWDNNNDWTFSNKPLPTVHPAYASYNAYQVMMHNVAVLKNPELARCDLYPATDFTCTAVDLRSGYFPDVINFAEQNTVASSEASNNINYQVQFQPTASPQREQYQLLVTNMYRLFFWNLIGQLNQDNWMCNQTLQNLRVVRAKKFFDQAESQQFNKSQDDQMFAQLASLMLKSRQSCPALSAIQMTTK